MTNLDYWQGLNSFSSCICIIFYLTFFWTCLRLTVFARFQPGLPRLRAHSNHIESALAGGPGLVHGAQGG